METQSCFFDGDTQRIGTTGTLNVYYNKFAIGVGHSLFAPPEHREELRPEDLVRAVEFAREGPGIVFHNMRGAGASRPEHLHFHAYLRDGTLPLEAAPRVVLLLRDAFTVCRVHEHPAYALAVRGPRRAHVALPILRALGRTPYNLFINPHEVIVVPRAKERPSTFENAWGALEMAGCLIMTDPARWREVTYPEIWDAIKECGWAHERGRAFERGLAVDLLGVGEADEPAAVPLPGL